MTKQLPTLYQRGKAGELRVWDVWTEGADVCTRYGVKDGAMQTSRYTCKPKNTGRANATTAEEQANIEAKAEWTKKRNRKYSEGVPEETVTHINMPMLAHPFFVKGKPGTLTTHGKKVTYPIDVQCKFDGVRAKARRVKGKVVLVPRSGQLDEAYPVGHIIQQLERWLPEGMEVDGELYRHGLILQEITGLCRKFTPATLQLKYYIYDVPMFEGERTSPWSVRKTRLPAVEELIERHKCPSLMVVKTIKANSQEDVEGFARRFRERGFEGAMLRVLDGYYEYGHRSSNLLKVKEHLEEEFEVIGCKDGDGKAAGTAIFVCQTRDKKNEFDVVMRGDLDMRQEFYKLRETFLGRMLTVSFMRWTKAGKPQEPVGEAFRDDADLPKEVRELVRKSRRKAR